MTLLDEVIEASGGISHWNALTRFSLQLSIEGALFSRIGLTGRFKDIVAEGPTRSQLVRFSGFGYPGSSGLYRPDLVTIEDVHGKVLRTWRNPYQAFKDTNNILWDELYLIFFCGFSVWSSLTTPFTLRHPDIRTEELSPWHEANQIWRRLYVIFPPNLITHSAVQIFYFNEAGLQRRVDQDVLGIKVAHYSWAHQAFNGIIIPTLQRSLALNPDGAVITKPPLIEVEIFDATFE